MNVIIKPDTLRALRESRNISEEVMATKLGLSKEKYLELEKTPTEFTTEAAEDIAKVFKRNWTVFLLENLPTQPDYKNDNRTIDLKNDGIGEKTYDALEEATYLLKFVESIAEDKTKIIPNLDASLPATTLASNFRKIVKVPLDVQVKFRNSNTALNYWIKVLGKLGINVSRLSLGDDDGVRAFSILEESKAIIVLNSDDTDPGKLFSLFHELAHILRRNTGICDLHRDGKVESYCNAFASEMLIPTPFFNSVTKKMEIGDANAFATATALTRTFKASRLAVLTRFLKEKKISPEKYDELYKSEIRAYKDVKALRLKQIAKRKAEGKKGGLNPYALHRSRVGNLFTQEIFSAMYESRITPFEASKYLDFKVPTLSKFNEWVGKNEV